MGRSWDTDGKKEQKRLMISRPNVGSNPPASTSKFNALPQKTGARLGRNLPKRMAAGAWRFFPNRFSLKPKDLDPNPFFPISSRHKTCRSLVE